MNRGRRAVQRTPKVVFTPPVPCQILAALCISEKFPTNHLLKEQKVGVEDKLSPTPDVWSYNLRTIKIVVAMAVHQH